jgi:AraC family transcriptional regulator
MPRTRAYGDDFGQCFGLTRAPAFVTRSLRRTTIAATELRCDTNGHGLTTSIPAEDSFLAALQVREYPAHEFWVNGKSIQAGPYAAGETVIYDVKSDPIAYLKNPFHSVFFCLPRSALDLIAEATDARRIDIIRSHPERGTDDPTMRHLVSALLPAFARPEQASTLFVDCVTLAVAAHNAQNYGDMHSLARPVRGGLAPWQERRAKEILSANLDGEVSISDLANECELSLSYFTRAFRRSMGVPPHRWLMQRRIDKAKDMLRNSTLSLSGVALDCGFADQSHFTAAFTRSVGTSPGAWRRAHRTAKTES